MYQDFCKFGHKLALSLATLNMKTTFYLFSGLLILLSVLPFSKNQHWIFRVPEFLKIQLFFFQLATIVAGFIFLEKNTLFWFVVGVQFLLMIYHLYILIRYTTFYKKTVMPPADADTISIISCNIYQFNQDFERFHQLIRKYQPDIFITMESNAAWEMANRSLEQEYPFTEKITLENTYGMHLYSKIPIENCNVHFFVADDIPSIEAKFKNTNGLLFTVFAVHPPPPSPTEESTSKERDGDLLSVAKICRKNNIPTLVIGDFNTVAWSDTSILFRKMSGLIDARVGRGILATFHAKYWFFRVPLDLLFHSPDIFIEKLKTLEYIGSDHLPIYCTFHVDVHCHQQEKEVQHIKKEEIKEVEQLIQEGKEEESSNRTQAS